MDAFWKTAAAVLLTIILSLAIEKQGKDVSIILILTVICMTVRTVLSYLEPVFDFLRELETIGDFGNGMLEILLKAVGIALVTEIACLVCQDSGAGSLGKGLQMLGSAAILYLSIPICRTLIHLIQDILGVL